MEAMCSIKKHLAWYDKLVYTTFYWINVLNMHAGVNTNKLLYVKSQFPKAGWLKGLTVFFTVHSSQTKER